MATSRDFHDYVMDRLSQCGEFSSRAMMGEYVVYYRDRVAAMLCDGQLLLKPTPSVLRLLPDAERACPYEGSKSLMVVVDDLENTELFSELFPAMYPELPEPKKKK